MNDDELFLDVEPISTQETNISEAIPKKAEEPAAEPEPEIQAGLSS